MLVPRTLAHAPTLIAETSTVFTAVSCVEFESSTFVVVGFVEPKGVPLTSSVLRLTAVTEPNAKPKLVEPPKPAEARPAPAARAAAVGAPGRAAFRTTAAVTKEAGRRALPVHRRADREPFSASSIALPVLAFSPFAITQAPTVRSEWLSGEPLR